MHRRTRPDPRTPRRGAILIIYLLLLPLLVALLVVLLEQAMFVAAQEQLITISDGAGAAAALKLGAELRAGSPSGPRAAAERARRAAERAAQLNGFPGPEGTLLVEVGRLRPDDLPREFRPRGVPNAVRVTATRRVPSILAGWGGPAPPPAQAQSVARAR
jgi:hypothetical protein